MAKAKLKPGAERRIGIPDNHPGQDLVEAEAEAILAANDGVGIFFMCAHRGWWKSSFTLGRCLRHLATGMPAGWYAPTGVTLKDTRENLFKKAMGNDFFDDCYNYSDNILRIPGMGSLHFFSLLEEDTSRGPTFPFIVGDEWGSLPDGVYQRVIEPIFEKAVVSYNKAEGWFVGTPNATGNPKNHFWKNLQVGINGTDPSTKGWIIPVSADLDVDRNELVYKYNPYANPHYKFERLKMKYANAERQKSWLIEWLCQFISDDGGQFERDAIEAQCVLPYDEVQVPIRDTSFQSRPLDMGVRGKSMLTLHLRGYKPKTGGWYQIGVDIGFNNDRCSIQVLDRSTMQMVYMHHFLPFGRDKWFTIYEAIAHAARMFKGAKINVDASGLGSHVMETLRRQYGIHVNPVVFGGKNKEPMLNHASSLLEKGQVKLFNLQMLKDELGAMQRKPMNSGMGFQIKAEKGGHDDAPMAFALMVHGIFPAMSEGDADMSRIIATTGESGFLMDERQVSIVNPSEAGGFAAAWDNYGNLSAYTG